MKYPNGIYQVSTIRIAMTEGEEKLHQFNFDHGNV